MKRLILLIASVSLVTFVGLGSQARIGSPKRAGTLSAIGAIQPRISPDGTTIACSYQGAIWTLPRSGGKMTRLTDGDGFDMEPAWSLDGKRIAFARSPYRGGNLHLVQAADGKDIPLPRAVQVRGTIVYPKLEFHPDGQRVLGVFRSEGKDEGLAWFDLQTGAVKSLLAPPTWSRFALSQDGRWIAYTATLDVPGQQTGNDGTHADIWKLPADGGQAEKIARFPSRIHDLCWDNDGKSLIVVTDLGGVHYDLWEVPLANSLRGMRKLTFGQADEDRPSISHDGRWLVYTDNRAGPTSLVLRDLVNSEDRIVHVSDLDFRQPTGTLRLVTRDKAGGKPVIARVSLRHEGGKFHAPPGALYRMLRDTGHFYCDQSAEFALPAGKYRLKVYRGREYQVAHHDLEIEPGRNRDLTVDLTRWTHQAARGWYSGENHIHANYGYGQWYNTPATMLQQCSGEDLNVCNFMVANSDTDGVFDRPFFRGGPDPLSTPETILYWNQEFRSTHWGHMTLVNLRQVVEPVFTGFKTTTNPWDIPTNADIADRAHWQKGHVNYTHAVQKADDPFSNPYAAKGLPIDVALGKIDSLDLNNAYIGTVPTWYRLLNCGFRLPGSAGTDCFLNRIYSNLPGGDRAYAQIKGPFSYADWIKGLKAGKSFVTNGPMLELSLGEHGIGDVVKIGSARKMTVRARASSQFPLAKVELIRNGQIAATATLAQDSLSGTIEQDLALDRSGWLALRATGPGHADSPLPFLYAHTSPIYFEVAGTPVRSRADAAFFLKWIEQVSVMARERDRVPNEELRQHLQSQLEAARTVYARIAKESD
jgi:hypothetical protein